MTAFIAGANPITDGVDLVRIIGLGLLALLPLITYSLVGFACSRAHRWDFVEGLAKAIAALNFTLNVCAVAWYVLKFYHGITLWALIVAALGFVWYSALTAMTLNQFPAGRQLLIRLSKNEGRPA